MDERTTAVVAQIQRIVREELGRDEVAGDARLVEDLHLDSMELTTLAVGLEDHFRVTLSEHDSADVRTVTELAELVARRQREGEA